MQRYLLVLIFLIFVVHVAALWNEIYYTHSWVDIPMHMAGGVFIGLLFYYLFVERHGYLNPNEHPWTFLLLGLGFTALIGVAWEWYEYFSQVYIQHTVVWGLAEPYALFDTLFDLFNDIFGGAVAILLVRFFRSK